MNLLPTFDCIHRLPRGVRKQRKVIAVAKMPVCGLCYHAMHESFSKYGCDNNNKLCRVAVPTVQRQHELSREGFPQYSLCPYGGIHWISFMNSTRQGNGSSSIIIINFVESRCPQYKGSTNCPRRVSLNTVSARMEGFIGSL